MDGYHYYANLYIDGDAPKKLTPGAGRCGIDPGVSSMAAVSEKNVFLEELAPEYKKYNKEILYLFVPRNAYRYGRQIYRSFVHYLDNGKNFYDTCS